ncbi:MAG: hypothetical protein LBH74_02455 [Nitrososphaerota archaeon]|nr:hypothetical protein [Nitrososphaerota archaeon]
MSNKESASLKHYRTNADTINEKRRNQYKQDHPKCTCPICGKMHNKKE